nr:ATP-binding protein [Oculatella sp. FACHB-28]
MLKRLIPIFRSSYKIPLQTALVLPFTLQVGLAVGLTCYFSLRSGQKTVDQVATHLTDEVSMRIQQQVAVLMETPHIVAQTNVDALRLGQIDLQNAARLERHFWKQMQLFPNLRPIAFANQQGEIHAVDRLKDGTLVIRVMDESTGDRYHTYIADEQGKRDRLIETDNTFDPRERPWYVAAVQAGEPTWTKIYPYFSSSDLAISAARPIYSETGELLGVTNATLSLAHLSSFLQELEVGHSGQTFIIERTGELVASSTSMRSFLPAQAQARQRLAAVDSENKTIQTTAEHLLHHYSDLDAIEHREQLDFEMNGERQIVQVTPFSDRYGLSWLVVVVVPETDFAPYIAANIRSTTLLCLIVMVVATVVAALTSQWIAQPIQRLSRSSKALAERTMSSWRWQELSQPIQATGIYELSVLEQAHNQIEAQLKDSITALAKANEQLEMRVEQRTAELQQRTNQLHQALQFEALLRRITDKVRDNLDEAQILQTAVHELGQELSVACCNVGMYDADKTAFTICYEYTTLPDCRGATLAIADSASPAVHQQLLSGLSSQFCFNTADPLRLREKPYAILACPLLDNQEVFGNLWSFKPKEQTFTDLEVRLVEQVANQCAIAIRQSRLFQSAQAQIEELKQLHQVKDDFLNTVSHELRTPISNMKIAIHLLRIAATPERNQQYLDILQAECAKETNLINDLLDLQRLESEHYSITPETIVLQDWIPDVISPFLTRSGDRQQHLQVKVPADVPPITSDPNVLERILAELLNNACKYTPSGGEIWLEVSHAENYTHVNSVLAFTISNTAEIPKANLSRIFEKFYRIPNTDFWKQGGTGLGLALVKKLTEQLGGTLTVESQQGQTTFAVLLAGTSEEKGSREIKDEEVRGSSLLP